MVVELVVAPLAGQTPGQLQADDALAETQNLGVVAENAAFDGIAVVRGDGADAGHLVGRYGNAEASAANQYGPVGLACRDLLAGGNGNGRVGGAGIGVDTNILDGGNAIAGFQVGFYGLLVLVTGVIGADDETQLVAHGGSVGRV